MCDRLDFWRYSSMLAEGEIVKAKIVCRTSLYRIFRLYIKKKRWTQKKPYKTETWFFIFILLFTLPQIHLIRFTSNHSALKFYICA